MINIILCGGNGTRLWPISRKLMPKQFVKLFDAKSLFQLIVSNEEQYFLAFDQLEELGKSNNRYLLEPVGRNTAPAIALACMALDKNEIVLVTPSDHLIKDEVAYKQVLEDAKKLAEIYKSCVDAIGSDALDLSKGKVKTSLPELIRIKYEDMIKIPEDSIDYAVMEKSKRVKVVPSDIEWSDVGSFDALAEELPNDENNNLIISDKLVKTIDIKDSIIVDTGDALLIAKKGSSQKVKEIVNELKRDSSELPNMHLTGHRPWGTYTILEDSDGYKIKRIEVKQGKRLSLQRHKHRNEHWIVVSGRATVTKNDEIFMLNKNESTYIQAGDIRRLSNDTNEALVIIEAQVGSYTGEDDIERLEDDFKRGNK